MIIKRMTAAQERLGYAVGGVIGYVLIRWLPPMPKWFTAALACSLLIAAPFVLVRLVVHRRRDRREKREAAWQTFVETRSQGGSR